MNGALLLLGALALFTLAYRLYAPLIERIFGFDYSRATPAHTLRDGIDYLPTHPAILFGHHFASIAGAGPIVGPILAAQFGWLPVVLWVVIGGITIGATHDLAAMFLSVRHQGRSIGTIIESLMGYWGRLLFLVFCWFTLILVVAEFTRLVAQTFIQLPAVATASMLFIAIALCFGILTYRGLLRLLPASLIFVPLTFAAVYLGTLWPLDLVKITGSATLAVQLWTLIILAYCYAASTMPVWLLLQPRDYLNSYLLYAMLAMGFVGILYAAPTLRLETFTSWRVLNPLNTQSDPLFPLLFVTVACGACSGFHALVATGTTAKQIANERHIRPIAYGGMLIESILAIVALIAVGTLSQSDYCLALKEQGPVKLFAHGIGQFTTRLGLPYEAGLIFIALALAAFLMTTIDTATRLARFTWQELFLPRARAPEADTAPSPASGPRALLGNRFSATLIVVALTAALLLGGGSQSIWPVFASSNQLLAALTLLGCLLWLLRKGRPMIAILLPMLFMMLTSGAAVTTLFLRNLARWRGGAFSDGGIMTIVTGLMICMSLILIAMCAATIKDNLRTRASIALHRRD